MKEIIETLTASDMAMAPTRVWSTAMATLHRKYGKSASLRVMAKPSAVSFVKNVRRELTGGDVFRAIELEPTSLVSADDARPFLQFSYLYAQAGKHKRMVGFAHPDLLRLLKYPKNPLFVDCTFKACPKPFSQVAIIMGFDPAFDLYLPIFYVLLQGKEQQTYWHMLDMVIMQCDMQVDPRTVTCDFELGLINAEREQFPGVPLVGCLFHWKQALRRKMLDLRIPVDTVANVMSMDEIISKGIPYVRSRIDESGHRVKWSTFWRYFAKTWMRTYGPSTWNVNTIAEAVDIVNRTNNALERFNRTLNESFTTSYPSLLTFVDVIKTKSQNYVDLIEDIRHQRQQPPDHANLARVEVPDDYLRFEPEPTQE
ncbi:hypothetical protein PHYSODRAFT_325182 [Phytophthora sojae]|uniref:MULE transposase domain-containing protein n=1 Tax=Phytophthora sojae (strain P6497) TaxID=1094619 RepID=G4Z127_PHYSP|nr:hypothetical protein PHYSODRAFT_325182 [Phytophthora sojae]EGZ24028.1 hypothetical protein PHYSODRAFT_325182 [Phytophthora sojae]|eukprot:XP_009519316.1 hypothetical protein PHYSODRAFT_325182 [Phytophthora sojae]